MDVLQSSGSGKVESSRRRGKSSGVTGKKSSRIDSKKARLESQRKGPGRKLLNVPSKKSTATSGDIGPAPARARDREGLRNKKRKPEDVQHGEDEHSAEDFDEITVFDKTQWEFVAAPPSIEAYKNHPEEVRDVLEGGGIGTEDVTEDKKFLPGESRQKTHDRLDYLKRCPKIMITIRVIQTILCFINLGLLLGPCPRLLTAKYGQAGIPVGIVLVFMVMCFSWFLGVSFFKRWHVGLDRVKNNWRFLSALLDLACCTILLTASVLVLNYGAGYAQNKFGDAASVRKEKLATVNAFWLVSGVFLILQISLHAYLMMKMLQKGTGPNF